MELIARKKGQDYIISLSELASGVMIWVFEIIDLKRYKESPKHPRWNPGLSLVEKKEFETMADFEKEYTHREDMRNYYTYGKTLRPNNIGI